MIEKLWASPLQMYKIKSCIFNIGSILIYFIQFLSDNVCGYKSYIPETQSFYFNCIKLINFHINAVHIKHETSETTVRNLHCLFLIFMIHCNYELLPLFAKLFKNPFKGHIQFKLWIAIYKEFQVVFTVSSFVCNPI